MREFEIYTDGSCRTIGNMGSGWAYLVLERRKEVFKDSGKGLVENTNNQMEITAVIRALERIQSAAVQNVRVKIYSDSAYVVNCFKDNWIGSWKIKGWINSKKQPVANKELWLQLDVLAQKYKAIFQHVKGGSNSYNRIVDRLAKKESKI